MTHVIVVVSALLAVAPADGRGVERVRVNELELGAASATPARIGQSTGTPTSTARPAIASTREAWATSGVPTNAVPTSVVPTSVVPTNAVPTNAVPTNAVPMAVTNIESTSAASMRTESTHDAPTRAVSIRAAPLSQLDPSAVPNAALTTPEPIAESADHGRVRRFLGAFLGGVVGFGVPLALAPVFSCAGGVSCLGAGHLALAFSSPLLGLTGSVAGYVAAGGRASAAGLGAIFPAALTTLGVMGAMSQMDPALLTSWLPAAIAGGAVLSLTSAALLTWREDATAELDEAPGTTATRVRVAATIAASTAMALAGFVAVIGGTLACSYGCSATMALTLSTLLLAGHAYATWAVHRALGGRAPAWSPLLLMALDLAATGLVVLAAWLPGSTFGGFSEGARNGLAVFTAATAAVAGLSIAPMLVFEALHTHALRSSKAGALHVGVAPAPGGGLVTAGLAW